MNNRINQLQNYLFILLGVFVPTSIAVTNFIIGLIAVLWIVEGNFKTKIRYIIASKWMLSLFGLIFLYVLGMLWGDNHLNAGWQFQRLLLLLLFPILATIKIDQQSIKYAVVAFLFTTFVSGLLAILVNNYIISPLSEYWSAIRPGESGAFIKYNYHNVLLALSFSLALYLIIENKTKHTAILTLFILVYALSIFTEKGRAGQVLFNLSAVFYILYYNKRKVVRSILFFLLLFGFQFLVYNSSGVYKSRFDSVSKIIQTSGGEKVKDIRYLYAQQALEKIFERPIFGNGTGSFGAIFQEEIDDDVKARYYHQHFANHITPHNQYLYVWFEIGIFGLISLILIFYYQIKELLKKRDGIHRTLLPLSFMFLMIVDSYLFIFTLTITYIFLYTIYNRFECE